MGWDISEKGFHIVLSPEVPDTVLAALSAKTWILSSRNKDLCRSDIKSWVMHTGGPKVLEATATALGITEEGFGGIVGVFAQRWGIFLPRRFFWFSRMFFKHRRPEPGTLSILAAMGPGFCSELVLLRW